MPLKTLLVMPVLGATYLREIELPFPPYPNLCIRLDVYDVLNVDSVVVLDHGYDVTCIVHLENAAPGEIPAQKCTALGFEIAPYP